jgi:hypothetical protein
MSTLENITLAKKSGAKMVDIKWVDTFGIWQHFSLKRNARGCARIGMNFFSTTTCKRKITLPGLAPGIFKLPLSRNVSERANFIGQNAL